MKVRSLRLCLSLVMVFAMAAPAFAKFTLNGYYRAQATAQSGAWVSRASVPGFTDVSYAGFNSLGFLEDGSMSFIDNRLRLRAGYSLNDHLSLVYFAEIDTPWGESSKGSIGGGGGLGADGVNVETKNAYAELKVPNSTWTVRTGMFGWGLPKYEGLVLFDDMGGINAFGTIGPVDLNLLYSRWNQGDRAKSDNRDIYAAQAGYRVNEQLDLTGMVTFLNDNRNDDNEYFVTGAGAEYAFGSNYRVRGFALYGNIDEENGLDGSSWMADIALFAKHAKGQVKFHTGYFPDDAEARVFRSQGGYEYYSDNLSIMMTDAYYNNGSQGILAFDAAAYQGFGLVFATISGDYKLPQDSYLKYGLGYFTALDDDNGSVDVAGKSLGTEVALMAAKTFAEKYDLSLRGSYVVLGDFFDGFDAGSDPDDPWKVVAMLNISF